MLQSIYFLPHGMQIIPGMGNPRNKNFEELHQSMEEIRRELKEEDPELIFLITPHGLNLQNQYLIYLHNEFIGHYYKIKEEQSVVYGELIESRNWIGDVIISQSLLNFLNQDRVEIDGLTQGYPDYPLTLSWGETVPLYYLPENKHSRIIIIGIPRSRHEKIIEIQKDLYKLGQSIVEYSLRLEKKVSIIISGDLSHTHLETGPYGYHETSKEFDKLIQNWSVKPDRGVFNIILNLQKTALACGMAGISMLQGIHEKYGLINKQSFYDLPTYFGMIVNRWKLKI